MGEEKMSAMQLEAFKEIQKNNDAFFNYFGLRGEERNMAANELDVFLEDFKDAKMGRGFFDSPLGRKAFMVGYFRGRSSNKKDETVNDEQK